MLIHYNFKFTLFYKFTNHALYNPFYIIDIIYYIIILYSQMRCPNGSRKNKLGDCIKKDLLNNTIKRKKSSNERKISEKDPSEMKSS